MPENVKDSLSLRNTIIDHVCMRLHNLELSNNDLIAIIQEIGKYGNCCSVAEYARREKISYNGALDRIKSGKAQTLDVFGERFVVDNY